MQGLFRFAKVAFCGGRSVRAATLSRKSAVLFRDTICRQFSGTTTPVRCTLDAESARDIREAIRTVLRRQGPMPLPQLSKCLDDETMERVSTYGGGLSAFVTSDAEERASGANSEFTLIGLPGKINVVFVTEYFAALKPSVRLLASWLAALFVAQEHFPSSRLLPSLQPTTQELFLRLQHEAPASVRVNAHIPSSVAEFELWLPFAEPILVVVGKRVVLGGRASKQRSQELVEIALRPHRGPSGKSPFVHHPRGKEAHDSSAAAAEQRAKDLRDFLSVTVPSTFFVPLSAVVNDTFTQKFPAAGKSVGTVQTFFAANLRQGFMDTHFFRARNDHDALRDVYVRLVDTSYLLNTAEDLPEATLTDAYSVFALGEKIVGELTRARSLDASTKEAQSRGISMTQLGEHLTEATFGELLEFFDISAQQVKADGTLTDCFILLFDRLRHIFDVNLRGRSVRPWSVLSAAEQPSSLTRETTPLPLLLLHAESVLRAETLTTEEFFTGMPALLQRQLLSAYSDARWLKASAAELHSGTGRTKGVRCLRNFVAQHSLYFVLRKDGSGLDRICSPQYLAAAVSASGEGGAAQSNNWRQASTLTETEKAEMVYRLLPADQPVAWTHFSNTPAARALPFPAFRLTQDFFRRHFSFFRLYEPLFSTTLIVGRADGAPPPSRVLQPPMRSVDVLIKYLALLSCGGTTDIVATNGLSKEGRAYLKQFGSFVALAEQLPQWFEVRRDNFNAGNSLITYVGPTLPTAGDEERLMETDGPLPRVRNDASCFLPENANATETDYEKWNPEWEEDAEGI